MMPGISRLVSALPQARQQNIEQPGELAAGCDVWESGTAQQVVLQSVDVIMPTEL